MEEYDVIVAGAGTGGAVAAYAIAKKGYNVALLDQKPRELIGKKTCGDAMGDHHFKELEELIGLPKPREGVIQYTVKGLVIYPPNRKNPMDVSGPGTTGVSFNRHAMGQWLIDLAISEGVKLYDEVSVQAPILEGDTVVGVSYRDKSKEIKKLKSKIVIDATGVGGVLRRQVPESFLMDKRFALDETIAAWREVLETSYTFERPDMLEIYFDLEHAPGGYAWIFPQGPNRVNAGLGVTAGLPNVPNVKKKYYDWMMNAFEPLQKKTKLLDAGGGQVPVRRPVDVLVGNGFMLVGDAASQVNPIHGGGIGPSMYAAALASHAAVSALESGNVSRESLWEYPAKYMRTYGKKQAGLDIFKWLIIRISNKDIDFAFDKGLIKGSDLLEISLTGKLQMNLIEKMGRLVSGLGNISLLRRLKKTTELMEQIKALYDNYPASIEEIPDWKKKMEPIYKDARNL